MSVLSSEEIAALQCTMSRVESKLDRVEKMLVNAKREREEEQRTAEVRSVEKKASRKELLVNNRNKVQKKLDELNPKDECYESDAAEYRYDIESYNRRIEKYL
jgi:hypothetical protein